MARKKSAAREEREFVGAARAENPDDPRVKAYDDGKRRARSEAAKRGHATRRARAENRRRAGTAKGREPVTARLLGPTSSAGRSPVSAPTVRMPRVTPPAIGAARVPRAPAPARGLVPPPVTPPRRRRPGRDLTPDQFHAVTQAGNAVAQRQQTRALMGAKPTVSGGAIGGAGAGAATGAALGSVVPGVGTAAGAGAGAVLGGAGGALSGARHKRAYKRATRAAPGAHKALVAEFAVCVVIVALSPLTDKHKTDPPGAFMKRMAAVMGVFLVLSLLSAAGAGAARTAAAFGGLVALVLAVSERDLFVQISRIMGGTPVGEKPSHAGEVAA